MSEDINYCRLCIRPDVNRKFISLVGQNEHYIEKFERYFKVFISRFEFPVLCPNCADKLNEIETICMMAKNSDAFFKNSSAGSSSFSPIAVKSEPLDYVPLEQALHETTDDLKPQSGQNKIKIEPKDEPSTSYGHASNNTKDTKEGTSSSEEEEEDEYGKIGKTSFIRNGKRVFPCQVCKKEFTQGRYRRMHYISVHPELNRFQCTTCNETFQFKTGYKKHCKKNMDHMICVICKAHFKDFGQYKNHENKCKRDTKKKEIFECPYCPKKFNSKNGCKDHCNTVHAKRMTER